MPTKHPINLPSKRLYAEVSCTELLYKLWELFSKDKHQKTVRVPLTYTSRSEILELMAAACGDPHPLKPISEMDEDGGKAKDDEPKLKDRFSKLKGMKGTPLEEEPFLEVGRESTLAEKMEDGFSLIDLEAAFDSLDLCEADP